MSPRTVLTCSMRRLRTPSLWGTQSRTRQRTFEPTSTSCETNQARLCCLPLAFRHNLQRQFFQMLPELPPQIFAFQRKLHRSFEEAEFVASIDRKSTRLNSSHRCISYAVFCLQ